jgi:anti-sigma regulatory factor (Ser/Thr protein kinase)
LLTFEIQLPARPDSLADVRAQVRQWLRQLRASREEIQDVVLACSEAAANAVEHGRPQAGEGKIVVRGRVDRNATLFLSVRDFGHWHPARSGDEHGRGLLLTRALVDDLAISRHSDGTEVTISRRLHEPARPPPAGAEKSYDAIQRATGGGSRPQSPGADITSSSEPRGAARKRSARS